MPTLQGTVQDANGSFCQRLVRAHRRDTGAIVAEGLSHPSTGAFSLATADTSKHYVVVHDNDAWITYLPMLGEHNSTLFGEWGGKAVTAYGDARLSTTESKFGGSAAYFDGSGDYLSLPASADLAFGTIDFTIDAWVRLDSLGVERALFDSRAAASDTGLYFGIDAANHLTVFGNNASIVTGNVALTASTWHHVALVRADGTMTLYRDGLPVGSAASAYAITCPGPVLIGRKLGSSSNDFAGYVDELIVRKGKAGFGAGYTLPTAPLFTAQGGDPLWHKTVLACHFNGPDESTVFVDQAGHLLTAVGGAQISSGQSRFGSASVKFSDNNTGNDVISIAGSDFNLAGVFDFTVECFVMVSIWDAYSFFLSYGYGASNRGWAVDITPTRMRFYWSTGGADDNQITGNYSFSLGNWYHLAAVRSGSVLTLYVDGQAVGSGSIGGIFSSSGPLLIGGFMGYIGISHCFRGYLDDLRITKAARYTANFTPSAAPFVDGLATFGQQNALIYDHLTPV